MSSIEGKGFITSMKYVHFLNYTIIWGLCLSSVKSLFIKKKVNSYTDKKIANLKVLLLQII